MIFALDTNVLLDILYKDESFHKDSREVLERKSEEGFFIINPEVYSELVSAFDQKFESPAEELDKFLDQKQVALVENGKEVLKLAGRKWNEYGAPEKVECSSCGCKNDFECSRCGQKVNWRNHLITDFIIGAHAEEKADALITRDRGYFGKYFDVEIIDPSR